MTTPTPLRPALAALAAAPTTTTIRRLWKALTPEERTQGITASLADDENGWVKATTRNAVAGALKFRRPGENPLESLSVEQRLSCGERRLLIGHAQLYLLKSLRVPHRAGE